MSDNDPEGKPGAEQTNAEQEVTSPTQSIGTSDVTPTTVLTASPLTGDVNQDTAVSTDLPLDTVFPGESTEATSAPSQETIISRDDPTERTVIAADLLVDDSAKFPEEPSKAGGDGNIEKSVAAKAVPQPDAKEASPSAPKHSTALLESKPAPYDPETTDEKLKYPKSVFFIISNEFCERFSFYGMRTILVIYLTSILAYSEDNATIIYHIFTMLCYFFPLFGSMLADSWLGKFRTIFYLSCVYCIGNVVISLASANESISVPGRPLTIVGLILIAIGTGGIKPCVSAFGGDQFVLPQQEKQMAQFFSLFYFSINSGSLVSTFLTPVLREEKCLDQDSCYPLAFGVPAALMLLSIIIFVCGKKLYIIKKPQGNVVLRVCKTMGHAVGQKWSSKGPKRDHWLDYADDKYAKNEIEDIKGALRVLFLYLPLPFFWALFDQQGSRWTFQAKRMTGDLGGWTLKPDQMQVVNPLLILIFIPLFETCIYPCMKKCNLLTKPLQRLGVGGVLAAVAFGISAIVELQLEPTYAVLPRAEEALVRTMNTLSDDLDVNFGGRTYNIKGGEMWDTIEWSQNDFPLYIAYNDVNRTLDIEERKVYSIALFENGFIQTIENVDKPEEENKAKIRVISNRRKDITIGDQNFAIFAGASNQSYITPGSYLVKEGDREINRIEVKVGGVYTLVIPEFETKTVYLYEITRSNDVHMLWLIPQYVVLTMGEVMFSVTGLEFSYSQAPLSMKSLMQAGWLLTVAFGNLIVVIIAEAKIFDRQLFEFILFAGLMLVDMLIFSLMALGYTYIEPPHEDKDEISMENTKEKSGVENKNFKSDED